MNRLLLAGATLGLVSVIMGAAADHIFTLTPEQGQSLETAIRYNMLYAILVVVIALTGAAGRLRIAGILFIFGAILFSFSIYAAIATGVDVLTYLTPVGGIAIMAGWCAVMAAAIRKA